VLNTEKVKRRVDAEYLVYLQGLHFATEKVMNRLTFRKQICKEMLKECGEVMMDEVRKRMKDDTLDMPEYLLEAQELVGDDQEVGKLLECETHRTEFS
jgi:hypothetical protein